MSPLHPLSRRDCLRLGGAMFGASLWPLQSARAADYKALVCVTLYGGNDGLNTIVPTDASRYAQYSDVRQALAIPQRELLVLDGEDYGLHPAMRAIHGLWSQRRLATVFNVGPLATPLTKAQYRAGMTNPSQVPGNLYSHSDQQSLWESATPDPRTRTGWGGRTIEAMGAPSAVIAAGVCGRFGLSSRTGPLVVSDPGTVFGAYELAKDPWRLQYREPLARANTLRALYAQAHSHALGQTYGDIGSRAFEVSERLAAIVKTQPADADANAAIGSAFAPLVVSGRVGTSIGRQLYQVAKLIAANTVIGGDRQVYAASQGSYDTHGAQIEGTPTKGAHATLLKDLADAIGAFDQAMQNLGLGNAVTLFTQSDFGRTFKPNSSAGTDHAWGNHHLVVGGAVRGGRSYGLYPELVLGGNDDVGVETWELHGRWIPTISVDQYAATLLRWFGAAPGQLDTILPNLANFDRQPPLNFV